MRRLATIATLVLLTGCDDYSGKPEVPPPPPDIPAGRYTAFQDTDPRFAATDQRHWAIDLPQGGRTRVAVVERCDVGCVALRLPVRSGLNGLSISFPKVDHEPAYDLAISVTPQGYRLSHDTPDGLWEAPLTEADPVPPLPKN